VVSFILSPSLFLNFFNKEYVETANFSVLDYKL
jgi:hypothetical protein